MAAIAPVEAPRRRSPWPWWAQSLAAFVVVAVAVGFAVWLGARGPIASPATHDLTPYTGSSVFGGWFRYDGRWYDIIASNGYSYDGPSTQSTVAFFPAYPVLLWIGHAVTGVSVKLLGTLITLACGAGAIVLFRRWCEDRVDRTTAMAATITLLLYPYAYYLMGALYADALFLVAALGAFVLLERGHPIAAGLAGIVATAARPVGIAVVVGLVAVTLWKKHAITRSEGRFRFDRRELKPSDAGVLLSLGGIAGWMIYLGVRFGHPLAFQEVQQAPGWDQGDGPSTWFKVKWFEQLWNLPRWAWSWWNHGDSVSFEHTIYGIGVLLQGVLVLCFLLLAWRAWRRYGWGYGVYSFALLAIPLVGTKDFQGAGRYLLAAFPCTLALADVLVQRPLARAMAWGAGGVLLLGWAFAFGRGYYVA